MTKKKLALEVIERLKNEYPDADCTLAYDKAWQLLVSVRLAAQCTDKRVDMITPLLYEKYPTLEALADAPVEKILRLYQTAGKQIFISFDKANSYSNEAERILNECARIRLAGGSHSLFGRSWGEKDSDN